MKGWDERQGFDRPIFVNKRYATAKPPIFRKLSKVTVQVRCGGDYNSEPPAHRTFDRCWKVGCTRRSLGGNNNTGAVMTTKFGCLTHGNPRNLSQMWTLEVEPGGQSGTHPLSANTTSLSRACTMVSKSSAFTLSVTARKKVHLRMVLATR